MDRILCKHQPKEYPTQKFKSMQCMTCGSIILLTIDESHALFILTRDNVAYKKPYILSQSIIALMMSCCKKPDYCYTIYVSHGYINVKDLEIKNGKAVEIQYGGK